MLRTAGIVTTLRDLGHDVEDRGDLALPSSFSDLTLREGKGGRRPQRLRPQRGRRLPCNCQRLVGPAPALRKLAALPPVAPEGDDVSKRQQRLPALDGPGQATT